MNTIATKNEEACLLCKTGIGIELCQSDAEDDDNGTNELNVLIQQTAIMD